MKTESMRKEGLAILLLTLMVITSSTIASKFYFESLELKAELSKSLERVSELEKSLKESELGVSLLEEKLSSKEGELMEAKIRIAELSGNLSELRNSLSLCLRDLNETKSELNTSKGTSNLEAELSVCRSKLSQIERASVHLVHWWYDSMGCVPCGTATTKLHVVLFNAGYETANNVRVMITLYDENNVPIDVMRIEVGSIPGREGKVIERVVNLSPRFQRAEVRVEWG